MVSISTLDFVHQGHLCIDPFANGPRGVAGIWVGSRMESLTDIGRAHSRHFLVCVTRRFQRMRDAVGIIPVPRRSKYKSETMYGVLIPKRLVFL